MGRLHGVSDHAKDIEKQIIKGGEPIAAIVPEISLAFGGRRGDSLCQKLLPIAKRDKEGTTKAKKAKTN